MSKSGLVRVSEDFRVIALGLTVPRYHGTPLDPPLRSRFQARDVTNLSYQVSECQQLIRASGKKISQLFFFFFQITS